jgi:hypothetical protein
VKEIKAALFRKLQVMENQLRFQLDQDHLEWLLCVAETPEQCDEVLSEISKITGETKAQINERRRRENGYDET